MIFGKSIEEARWFVIMDIWRQRQGKESIVEIVYHWSLSHKNQGIGRYRGAISHAQGSFHESQITGYGHQLDYEADH